MLRRSMGVRAGTASLRRSGSPRESHWITTSFTAPSQAKVATRVSRGRDGALGGCLVEIATNERREPLVDLRALGLVGGAQAHRLEEEDARQLPVARERLEAGPECGFHLGERAV